MALIDFKKNVLKNTFIYTLTDGVSKALSFCLLPIVSRYLLPEQLGVAANFDVLLTILLLLAGQAIVNALPYFFYERTKKQMALLVTSLLVLIGGVDLMLGVIIMFGTGMIRHYLHIGLSLQLLTVVSTFAYLVSGINLVLYRLEEKPYSFSKLQLLHTSIHIALTFTMIIGLRMEALGRIYSIVCTYVFMSVIHLFLLIRRQYLVFAVDKVSIKLLLKFGVPLLPHSLSFWLKSGMDKILLTTFCGLAVNGLYSMAMSFGAIYSLFYQAFCNAFVPYLQKRIHAMTPQTEEMEKVRLVTLSYKVGVCFLLLYFIVVGVCWGIFHYILDSKYRISFQFVPYILLASTINSFYGLVIQYPYAVKKTLGLGCITFTGSLIQLFLTYWLTSRYGVDGIKGSLVVGALIIMLGVWWYSHKVYPMPWFSFRKAGRNAITDH